MWQSIALSNWREAGRRGIVEAATGTGKTIVAIAAIAELHAEHGDQLRVAIVVPTIALAQQWTRELNSRLGLTGVNVGEKHSDAANNFDADRHPVLIAVLATASNRLGGVLAHWHERGHLSLLIVDECHRAGADSYSRVFTVPADFGLGLSATPERDDEQEKTKIYPYLGEPVFRYPLITALDDDVLAPVVSINLYVDFDGEESSKWDSLAAELAGAIGSLTRADPTLAGLSSGVLFKKIAKLADSGDPVASKVVRLLAERRDLLAGARARRTCLRSVLSWLASSERKAVVFHETIPTAERTFRTLHRGGVPVGLDHSGLPPATRKRELDGFRRDRYRVMVAVRALDEGIDVPSAEVAVISAGTRSKRQRIQRIGRILRPGEGKVAVVISILVRGTPEESIVGGRDVALLGVRRVRHHRWPMQTLRSVLPDTDGHCPLDTYAVPKVPYQERQLGGLGETVRELTIEQLGLR